MEQTTYRLSNRCWSNMDGDGQVDDFASGALSKTCFTYGSYKIQREEPFNLQNNYGPSLPENCDESSIFYTPWSDNADNMKPTASTQVKTKAQTERNKYGSEADLYGIVSNILDEPEKAQSLLDGGFSSSILKTPWSYNINRPSDHQGIFPDFKQSEDLMSLQQSLYDTMPVLSTENVEFLEGLNDLEQDEHWLNQYTIDNPSKNNAKVNPSWCSHPNSYLSENPKISFQKSDALAPPLNQCNVEDVGRYDMSDHGKTIHNKHTMTGLQDVKGLSSVLAVDTYGNKFPAKQNYQTLDNFILDQAFNIPKTKCPVLDRSYEKETTFISDYDHKPDFGIKTPCSDNMDITSNFQKLTSKQELQNSHLVKSPSLKPAMSGNIVDKLSWTNGQMERNRYNNQVKPVINLSASQKNPAVHSKYSYAYLPLLPGGNGKKSHSENQTYSSLDYGYSGANRRLEGFGKSTEFESVGEKRLKTLNGSYENASSLYSSLDRNVMKTIQENKQKMSFNVLDKNYESMVQSYKELFSSALSYSSPRTVGHEKKLQNSSKLSHPQSKYFSNGWMMGDMSSNFNGISSSSYSSPISNNLGYSIYPMIDSHDPYSYENQSHVWPQITDLLNGDTSLQGLAAMINTQRSAKARGIPANELHLCLDECYEQCRALEKERKKTESILIKFYPGKKVSSTNNVSIPRLSTNPSRVDRLIVDQLREQARVVTLLGKMERFRSSPLHANISTTLDRYLEAIHHVQAQRKIEIMNTSNHHQKHGRPRHNDDRDVVILASYIREMTVATRKARTALWCALLMTLPKSSSAQNIEELIVL